MDTADDSRYNLDYIRSVIDAAQHFGAAAYVSIDNMPRALSNNQTANRTDCATTFMNAVSNNQPLNADVFANAAVGLVSRVVEGTGSRTDDERPRNVAHWEVWNEPELLFFRQPGWDDPLRRNRNCPGRMGTESGNARGGPILCSRHATATARKLTVLLDGEAATPADIFAFDGSDDPVEPLRTTLPTGKEMTIPANSLMVLEF